MPFNVKAAREAGYTEQEIAEYLAKENDFDLSGARKNGYSDEEIVKHLAGQQAPELKEESKTSPGAAAILAGGIGAGGEIAMRAGKGALGAGAKYLMNEYMKGQGPTKAPVSAPPVEPAPYESNAGFHPGATSNAAFNEQQRQANLLHSGQGEGVPPGYEVRGNSRIIVPQNIQPAGAAPQKPPLTMGQKIRGAATLPQMKASMGKGLGALDSGMSKIPGASSAARGAGLGYNLQDMSNRAEAGDTTGALIGGVGAAASLTPKVALPRKLKPLAPAAGAIAGGLNALRGEPESVMQGYAEGGRMPKSKKDLAAKAIGYLLHTPQKPNSEVGSRYTRELVGDLLPKTDFDPQKYKGASVMIKPWDSTNRGYDINSVSGIQLLNPVRTHGGQDFARDAANSAAGIGGASGKEISKRILSRQQEASRAGERMGGTGEVMIMPATMGPGAENFSSMPINILMDLMKQRELSPRMYKRLNEQVRALKDPKKGHIFENFVGFDDPRVTEQMMKGGYGLNTTPGELRKGMTNRLGLVENQRLLDYNIDDLTGAITDPSLVGYGKGFAGNTVIRGNPEGKLGVSDHPDYAVTTPGSYEGSAANMPVEFWLPDAYRNTRTELAQKRPGMNESNLHNSTLGALEKRKEGFSGIINDEVIDNYGRFKEGLGKDAFDPKDLWSIREYMGTKYAKGGGVDRRKLKTGLGMLPMDQRTDMRKMGQTFDERGGSGLAYDMAKEAYNHPLTQAGLFAGQFVSPQLAIGMMGKDLINDVSEGDYGSAGLNAGLNALPFAKQGAQAMRKIPGALRGMMGGAERSVMPGMVPAYAGGGKIMKRMMDEVMGGFGPKAAREIEAGAPHTYPPQATGPWMRDYQPAPRPEVVPAGGNTFVAQNVPRPSEQAIAQYGLKNAMATQNHPAIREAQDRTLQSLMEQKRMGYIRDIMKNDPSASMEELMQMYPRYETWMR